MVSKHALQVVSQHALQVSRGLSPGPQPGRKLRALARGGVSRSTPRGVCIPACSEADPPPGRLLPRTVRILLECILVVIKIYILSTGASVLFIGASIACRS